MKAWQHFKTITKHRWLVRGGCFRVGLYWQGLTHDLSKYTPTEFWNGAHYYQGTRSPNNAEREEKGYSEAWMHHKGRNPHHYEYWQDNFDNGGEAKEMPWKYKVEMICDYLGAARAYMGKNFSYKAELEWWNNKMKQPRRQHFNDMAFVGRVLTQLAHEEKLNRTKESTDLLKYVLVVEKKRMYGENC